MRIEKILATVLHEDHGRQVEETIETLRRGRKGSTEPLIDLEYEDFTLKTGLIMSLL